MEAGRLARRDCDAFFLIVLVSGLLLPLPTLYKPTAPLALSPLPLPTTLPPLATPPIRFVGGPWRRLSGEIYLTEEVEELGQGGEALLSL